MKKLPSKRFGGWEMRKNGLKQHGMSSKQFLRWAKDFTGCTHETAKDTLNELIKSECWYSDCGHYKVVKKDLRYIEGHPNNLIHDPDLEGMTWLSIRIDNGQTYLEDWRDFQAIKNDLCGEDRQAVQIYPPESMLHDTDNVFHLFVFKQNQGLMVGWTKRDVSYHESPVQRQEGK